MASGRGACLDVAGIHDAVWLHEPPSPMAGSIRLAADLTQAEVQQSAVALNACTSRPLSIRKWIGAQLKLDNQRA